MSTQVEVLDDLVLENWDDNFVFLDNFAKSNRNISGWDLTSAVELVAGYTETTTVFDIARDCDVDYTSRRYDDLLFAFIDALTTIRLKQPDVQAQIISAPDNALNEPASTATWQERFNHKLALHMVENGIPMYWGDTYFGWEDYNFRQRMPNSRIVVVKDIRMDHWDSFVDTEADSSHHCGYTAHVIYDNGKQYQIRWEGEATDLIRSITK